jgi:SulP family sulfate permease
MRTVEAFPFMRWLPVSREVFKADLIAGLTVSMLLVPQSMAYAQLAGLPPHYGLCTAFVPTLLAALFGWCPQLQTGPVAMTSLLTASVLAGAGLAVRETPEYISLAAALALMVGAIRIVMGVCRLATLANLLSHPVIVAFTAAGAVIIALSQAGQLLGIPMPSSDSFRADVFAVLSRIREAHIPTVVLGAGVAAALILLKAFAPRWPGTLITVVAATFIGWSIGYEQMGGSVVGSVPGGLPMPGIPNAHPEVLWKLLPGAAVITVIGFLEVLAVCKSVAARTGQRMNLDQELVGQGVANVGGAFFHAFPASGSLSRSALNLYSGARSAMSAVVSSLVVLAVLLVLTPALYHVPRVALAAVIVVAVSGLVDPMQLVRIARVSRADAATAAVTIVATLAMAPRIVEGVLVGAGLAVVVHLYKIMTPHAAVLGRHQDGTLRDAERHNLPVDRHILAVRFDGRLIFANAERFEEFVLDARSAHPTAKALLVVAEGINDIDSSGEAVLRRLVDELRSAGMRVAFAQIKSQVEDRLRRSGLYDRIGADNMFRTADAAWEELERSTSTHSEAAG